MYLFRIFPKKIESNKKVEKSIEIEGFDQQG